MTLFVGSRYTFSEARVDAVGRLLLTDPEPYRFQALPDNVVHVVSQGDTLWGLAGRYYQPMERAAGYWWAIADFQPNPIHDPTIQLVPNSIVIVPSLRTLLEEILGEKRRNQ